ncbi:hypothetical protein R8O04_26955, partial [Vibrio sp. 2094]|uniref:hypothetical protein n=1 Tax=Vibrio sp. 2094 TaxID=3074594 RepID=UPI00296608CE
NQTNIIFSKFFTDECAPTACTKFDHDSNLNKGGNTPRLKNFASEPNAQAKEQKCIGAFLSD